MARKKKEELSNDGFVDVQIKTSVGEMSYSLKIPNHASNVLDRSPKKIFELIYGGLRRQFPRMEINAVHSGSKPSTSE